MISGLNGLKVSGKSRCSEEPAETEYCLGNLSVV
jgi:hypothetical protein